AVKPQEPRGGCMHSSRYPLFTQESRFQKSWSRSPALFEASQDRDRAHLNNRILRHLFFSRNECISSRSKRMPLQCCRGVLTSSKKILCLLWLRHKGKVSLQHQAILEAMIVITGVLR